VASLREGGGRLTLVINLAAATTSVSWPALVIALLGSSAVGAIVGGYITTRLRGRIEREEAWRTRLVDASEEFLTHLGKASSAFPVPWLIEIEEDRAALREDGGELGEEAAAAIKHFAQERPALLLLLSRIELLFGPDASSAAAVRAVRNLDSARGLLTRELWAERAAGEDPEALEIAALGSEALEAGEEFDSDDDSSLASWVRILVESSAAHRRTFMGAAIARIHSQRPSRMREPEDLLSMR
jgi:hypothetical protein